METVADAAAETEARAELPGGAEERFAGYGVMGLPFASGHVLAMRRFPASSIGPRYTSIWHRDPAGAWTFWQDQPADLACPRYFGAALAEARQADIELEWTGPDTLRLAVPAERFEWVSTFRPAVVTTVLNGVGSVLPDRWWRSDRVLSVLGPVAGAALRAGHVGLAGEVPNGQHFQANPLKVWLVAESTASLAGVDFGSPGRLEEQARLGDFWIPQRGVFAVGRAFFSSSSTDGGPA
jgi:hypothetical protein